MTETTIRISVVRLPGRAVANLGGKLYGGDGPGAIYRLSTLLYLDGHLGQSFEVRDDRSPTGGPGGLAMTGKVRNWAVWIGRNWAFHRDAKREPDFMADQARDIATAAGRLADLDQKARPSSANARQCA